MQASIILPACNQGRYLRETIESAEESLKDAGFGFEFMVVDDGSTDGCCEGIARERVNVLTNEKPVGASRARHQAMSAAQGDIFLMSDPHCSFPVGALTRVITLAAESSKIVMPKVKMMNRRITAGGGMTVCYRGAQLERPKKPRPFPSLVGTIYAFDRAVFSAMLSFPRLPGVWGYQEQAMTLLAYKNGYHAIVDNVFTCRHRSYRRKGTYPFKRPSIDFAKNAFYCHALCLPQTWSKYWKPLLTKHFGTIDWLDSDFEEQSRGMCQKAERSDDEVLTMLCNGDWKQKYREVMEA